MSASSAPKPKPKVVRIDDAGNPVDPADIPLTKKPAKRQANLNRREADWRDIYPTPTIIPADSRFNTEEWNVPAADNKGHSARVQVRIPPIISRCAEVLQQSGKFPYLTVEDLYRHAVIRHIYWLQSLDTSIPRTTLFAADAILKMAKSQQEKQHIREALETLRMECEALAQDNNLAEIRSLCLGAKHYLSVTSANSIWRKKIEKELREITLSYLAQGKANITVLPTTPTSILSLPKPDDDDD